MAITETKAGEGRFESIWNRVRDRLRADIGLQRFTYWIEPLRVVSASETRVVIACSSRFERDKVLESHGERIQQLIADVAPAYRDAVVDFVVETRPKAVSLAVVPQTRPVVEISPAAEPKLVDGSIPLSRGCTFASFVTGRSNQVAFNEAKRAAEADIPQGNPLFFFGGTGLGKSHLMHAIAWKVLEKDPTKRVLFITAETFMRRFVTAVKGGATLEFKDVLRNVDLLLVDDVHFILSKEGTATQEEFFHTFDALTDANKQIVLSADRSPSLFDKISDRVRSRLIKGASVEIGGTDLDLRLAILESKVERLAKERPGISIGSDALHYMAQRIATNTRELEGALNRVVTQSESGQRPVTIENLQVWLADFLKAYDRRVTIEEIKRRVADHFQLKVTDLESPNRSRSIVRPRQIAMYLSRILTPRSFPEIGKRFGDRDHTTVMHAVATVKDFIEKDSHFSEEVESLRLSIRNWAPEHPLSELKTAATQAPVQPQI